MSERVLVSRRPMTCPRGRPATSRPIELFTMREAAEAFAEGDPFVLNEAVRAWEVWEWDEVLAE